MNENEELAIISNVSFGMNDRGFVGLSFVVHCIVYSSGQFLIANDAVDLIKRHQITNINHLDGKPCIVKSKGNTMIFIDLKKI